MEGFGGRAWRIVAFAVDDFAPETPFDLSPTSPSTPLLPLSASPDMIFVEYLDTSLEVVDPSIELRLPLLLLRLEFDEVGRGAIGRYDVEAGAEAVDAAGTKMFSSSEDAYAEESESGMSTYSK